MSEEDRYNWDANKSICTSSIFHPCWEAIRCVPWVAFVASMQDQHLMVVFKLGEFISCRITKCKIKECYMFNIIIIMLEQGLERDYFELDSFRVTLVRWFPVQCLAEAVSSQICAWGVGTGFLGSLSISLNSCPVFPSSEPLKNIENYKKILFWMGTVKCFPDYNGYDFDKK